MTERPKAMLVARKKVGIDSVLEEIRFTSVGAQGRRCGQEQARSYGWSEDAGTIGG